MQFKFSVTYQQLSAYIHQNLYLNKEAPELNQFVEYCKPISQSSERGYIQIVLFGEQLLTVQRLRRYLIARPSQYQP